MGTDMVVEDLANRRLLKVHHNLVEMTHLVEVAMYDATQALMQANLVIAQRVITNDDAINAINNSIEQNCLEILSADDLTPAEIRMTVASLRMSTTLERMGDLAAHVAKQARLRYPNISVPDELKPTFARMGEIANEIVKRTGQVIESGSLLYAADMTKNDEEMDAIHRELFSAVLSPDWKHGVESAIDTTLLSRFYERFADHGVTIARRVAFVVTGEAYGMSDLSHIEEN
jgi:phosphate transport system protein